MLRDRAEAWCSFPSCSFPIARLCEAIWICSGCFFLFFYFLSSVFLVTIFLVTILEIRLFSPSCFSPFMFIALTLTCSIGLLLFLRRCVRRSCVYGQIRRDNDQSCRKRSAREHILSHYRFSMSV